MTQLRIWIGSTAALVLVLASASFVHPINRDSAARTELAEMNWVQVRTAIADGYTTVIVPSGGIEQNGEHMVLSKHDRIVRRAARDIAAELNDALVAPVLSFVPEGDFDHPDSNMRFPGTVGLHPSTFRLVLEDVAESLKIAGFKTICFIADHGQSGPEQAEVARRLDAKWRSTGVRVLSIGDYYGADAAQRTLLRSQGETDETMGSHAGIQDTSELLFADPSGVALSRAPRDAAASAESGASGFPGRATVERGKELLALKVKAAVAQIRRERVR